MGQCGAGTGMKLVCPGCGAQGSIELFAQDANARQFAALMGRIPPQISDATLGYLTLFRPSSRALNWSRGKVLLEELVQAIEAGAVRRCGRDWAVTPADFKEAMQEMVRIRDKLDLPLKNHGYLLEILKSASNRTEAKAEKETEKKLMSAPQAERQARAMALNELFHEKQHRVRFNLEPLTPDEEAEFIESRVNPS